MIDAQQLDIVIRYKVLIIVIAYLSVRDIALVLPFTVATPIQLCFGRITYGALHRVAHELPSSPILDNVLCGVMP